MSEAPTHSAGVPTPARPQQAERTPQGERAAQVERHVEERVTHTDRMPQQTQRHDQQRREDVRTDQARGDQTRTEQTRAEQTHGEHAGSEQPRLEQQRAEHHRTEQPRSGQQPVGRLEDEWQAVQYEFVDDPKAAVHKADQLVTRALEELTTRHRSLTQQLEGNRDPQTEDLRLALHRYRELFRSLVSVK
ncbi:hypothetical protein [Lentzea jiangxiensis]|uniref:Uncharacterized protein n=1 Tax=Lentzea jiangxiensis TaxID=641025 RepID=A0A1H0W5F4_9PSEU|nr:hypothetical protein [Lentzea jiangxiensis]SDP85818.1 hypothetical protein SAMN05421507_11756 [Lentzea jiangxiensis]